MKRLLWISIFSILVTLSTVQAVFAQEATPPISDTVTIQSGKVITHTVEEGENLYSIAELYGKTLEELFLNNSLNEQSLLTVGQTLLISGDPELPLGTVVISDTTLIDIDGYAPVPKFHRIAEGETLATIAQKYGITTEMLLGTNPDLNDGELPTNRPILIPTLRGELLATNYIVQLGDSLAGIADEFNIPKSALLLNKNQLINSERLIAGQRLRVVSRTGTPYPQSLNGIPHLVRQGESLTAIASRYKVTPVQLANANRLIYPTPLYQGQLLRVPTAHHFQRLAGNWRKIVLTDPPSQGKGFGLYVESAEPISPTGSLSYLDPSTPDEPYFYQRHNQTIVFMPYQQGYLAMIGLDAFTPGGLYQLALSDQPNSPPSFAETISLKSIDYGFQAIPLADNPSVRSIEDELLGNIYAQTTITRYWSLTETLLAPIECTACYSGAYGAARSYADQPVRIFHSGVDFGQPIETPVRSAASGIVAYTGTMELRGNIIIIDHGWGIMTSYFHLNRILVQTGQKVTAGEAIGALGNTGLSTAPHLHWEVRVHNIPIDGMQWLKKAIGGDSAEFLSPTP